MIFLLVDQKDVITVFEVREYIWRCDSKGDTGEIGNWVSDRVEM